VAELFDATLPDALAKTRTPGTVVSVVSGGQTVFAKGYGVADTERGTAFDPDRSLVRIASITKLFTWTAVMQQVEAGKLDLDADVNRYLQPFKIPATYPQPITLRTLMDHTAGFESQIIGTGAETAADVPPLGDYLAHHIPARIRPPGVVSAYSNYGAALAGYLVSRVSGEPYDQYVQRHILDPLGMAHTTATEPVPAGLAGDLAHSYNTDKNPVKTVPFIFDPMTPDGSISASATDMAKFMTAHLDGGPILTAPTMAAMHTRSFTVDPRIDGYAHGFKERTFNGHRVLMHDGGWEAFVSGLLLVPDCDLGLFMSANGTGGGEALADVLPKFFDRFAPTAAAPPQTTSAASQAPPAGFYKPTAHAESTMEKVLVLLGPSRLTVDGNGTVHFHNAEWKPDGSGLYTKADGTDHLAMVTGKDGHGYLVTDTSQYQLEAGSETLPVNLVVLGGFVLATLTALALPIAAAVRRLRRRPATTTGRWRTARWLAAGAAGLGLLFLVAFLATLLGDTSTYIYGAPAGFKVLLAVPILALVAAAGALTSTIVAWRGAGASITARAHQVLLLGGLATLTWFLLQWNLVGWQLP
jgi:CubicO group peptidase (beta-lactamase class C family)